MTTPASLATSGSPDDDPHDFYDLAQLPTVDTRPAETVTAAKDTADETLAVWAAAGDPAAFGELYRRYHRLIGWHLRRRGVNPADVDDLVHEVFITALTLLQDGAFPEVSVKAWLSGYAGQRVLTAYFSKQWERRTALTGVKLAAALPQPGATPPPGLSVRLVAALDTLRPRDRQIIELRLIEGQSAAATALITGFTERSVVTYTHRAVKALYKALTGTDRPRRPRTLTLEERFPIALEIAAETLAAGDRWGFRTIKAGFKARGLPLDNAPACELVRMVREAMPQTGSGRQNGVARRQADGGAR